MTSDMQGDEILEAKLILASKIRWILGRAGITDQPAIDDEVVLGVGQIMFALDKAGYKILHKSDIGTQR